MATATLTNQEIFDRVVTHLAKQGCKSVDAAGTCVYRGGAGMKCVVGCLITDENYTPELEGWSLPDEGDSQSKATAVASAVIASGVPEDAIPLLRRLQDAHDTCAAASELRGDIAEIAAEFSLTFDPSVITKWS